MAIGDRYAWTGTTSVPAAVAPTDLRVHSVGNHWCITWQSRQALTETSVVAVTAEGQISEALVLSGSLIDARAVPRDGVRLILVDATGREWSATILLSVVPPVDPILIPAVTLPLDNPLARAPELDPILIPANHGWGLLWHEGSAPSVVRAKTVSADGRLGMPIDLTEGRIVATLPQPDGTTHVVVLQPDGQLTDFIVRFGMPMAPAPIDGPAIVRVNDMEVVADARRADVRLHQLSTANILTWWASPKELRAIELGAEGPLYPVQSFESRGATTYQQVLVRRALDAFAAK